MPKPVSTRRLGLVTGAAGLAFGLAMAGFTVLQGGVHPAALVLTVLVTGGFFGGGMFLVFYYGFVRPRQLDPDPPEVADRRITRYERFWGDGRPQPVWLRRMTYAGGALIGAVGLLTLVLGLMSRSWFIALGLFFLAMAALCVVTAQRASKPRSPYSTWHTDRPAEQPDR